MVGVYSDVVRDFNAILSVYDSDEREYDRKSEMS